jgi:hypothetical protein
MEERGEGFDSNKKNVFGRNIEGVHPCPVNLSNTQELMKLIITNCSLDPGLQFLVLLGNLE